jgi:hypothetical protein
MQLTVGPLVDAVLPPPTLSRVGQPRPVVFHFIRGDWIGNLGRGVSHVSGEGVSKLKTTEVAL